MSNPKGAAMAKYSMLNENSLEGNFFVDTRCIGCNTCARISPEVFTLKDDLSYIKKQPSSKEETEKSILALLSCPVFSIGMRENKEQIKTITHALPQQIEDNIYFCSFNSEKSYGANSYFIKREKGNILIDSPRYNTKLVKNIERNGGLAYIYLTHKDDIADYKKFKEHFAARVIFHEDDFNEEINQADITLKGSEVYTLDEDIKIIPQSGHTKGHTVLLYKDHYLFSGDHLAYSSQKKALVAFKNYCWYDWNTQLDSLEELLNYDFSYILAGHGESFKGNKTLMNQMLTQCLTYHKR